VTAGPRFRRDRISWVAYGLLAFFAYLQAAPGLVLAHLRSELHLDYSTGGLHVAAFAVGSLGAGLASARIERRLGRRVLLWTSAATMSAGAVGLAAGPIAPVTIASVLVMGFGGGLLLVTVQAVLADRHGEHRAVALAEANLAASGAYVVLIGVLTLAAAIGAGWRIAMLACLAVPLLLWLTNRRLPVEAPPPPRAAQGRLPGRFWIAAAMLLCTTAVEWCVTGWGASFAADAARVSADLGVTLMGGYFAGVLVGRAVGSGLARLLPPRRLLALALGVSAVGFAILWPSTSAAQAFTGLAVIGAGIGNLFPTGLAIAVALATGRAVLASGRAVVVSSLAVLLAPLTVGALADATSLRTAFVVVPVLILLAAIGLLVLARLGSQPEHGARPDAEDRRREGGMSDVLAQLRRWEDAGGQWHATLRADGSAVVALERCDLGETVETITSGDPAVVAALRRRGSSAG
jgi:MFS family permease